ncbi:MAG TPA: hypothetical protein PLE74_10475 [Candidatus Cloacimonadota bacterium]|nr:hypothetical protein [Candidatus Cloacimonadota bacterium]HPT72692.1 hypothetical protein [Candidatus Cloacimonadota bacterium]
MLNPGFTYLDFKIYGDGGYSIRPDSHNHLESLFCSLRNDHPEKSTEQLLFEFYQEMQENWLDILCFIIFQSKANSFLCYALEN